MFDFWCWTYARLYLQQKRAWGIANQPALMAAGGLSLAILTNVLTIMMILKWIFRWEVDFGGYKWHLVTGHVLLLSSVYWRYGVRKRAEGVIKKLQSQGTARARREEARMWWYVFGSPIFMVVVGVLVGGLGT